MIYDVVLVSSILNGLFVHKTIAQKFKMESNHDLVSMHIHFWQMSSNNGKMPKVQEITTFHSVLPFGAQY